MNPSHANFSSPVIDMATNQQVRQYLAYWFQLGKKVWINNGNEAILPTPVIQGDRYSDEFEACWQRILSAESNDCHLDGTHQTIQDLLTEAWEIVPCARCAMPVPVMSLGPPISSPSCPCSDLSFWPDNQSPSPRMPVSTKSHLTRICDRLRHPPQETPSSSSASDHSSSAPQPPSLPST